MVDRQGELPQYEVLNRLRRRGLNPMVALNFDASYPGIDIKYEMSLMKEYLNHMEAGIESVKDKYLAREETIHASAEYFEYSHIYVVAEYGLARFVRQPFVVSIYSLYESSFNRLMDYAQKKEERKLSHRDIANSSNSYASKINKYVEHVLNFKYQLTSSEMGRLKILAEIRNLIAHGNGSILSLPKEKLDKLKTLEDRRIGVAVEFNELRIEHAFLVENFELVASVLKRFMDHIEQRYDQKWHLPNIS
ncbi:MULTISPECIES: hypothetical protein [Pseudomonas fluorescens group]|uniref:MAE-28990/MAE-18760-like HEPN domain-containing protein n=1 Tax=Pseudomonas fluorescens TaxID=294 RepID=A0A0D0RTN4_PSEFL|nr:MULTISPECIES: hypothetical protein [Pseudomonas fluorescens group]AZE61385.1 hypothetical protein C4K02_3025 [Pseudomonas synxantha]KIR22952.1 hypothetical protein PFLU3_16350 [Pseudomonas fluorescens]